MIDAINRVAEAIERSNNGVDYAAIVSAVCSVISLVAIILLLIERHEKKRPYLQVSFELKRSNLACLVIRNVGEVSAKLGEIAFNESFREQLPQKGQKNIADRSNLNISIHPKQQWVIALDVLVGEAMKYRESKLSVTIKYSANGKKKTYTEVNEIEFQDYKPFLIYISEIDELKKEIHLLAQNIQLMRSPSVIVDRGVEEISLEGKTNGQA